MRVKLKDIINGGVVETTFRPTESFQEAFIERKKMQYLYNDGDLFYFMDNETFDQIAVSAEDVGDSLKFVKENEEVTVSLYQEKPFAIEPPLTVELQVTETEPGFKGKHRTGRYKAGYRGDRSAGFCSAVCRPGRDDQDRHPYRRIPVQSIRDAAPSGVFANFYQT